MTDEEKAALVEEIAREIHTRTCHWPDCQLDAAGENRMVAQIAVDVIANRLAVMS